MSRVRVSIDRLTLDGLAPAQRDAVLKGLRAELSRLFADPAARAAWARARRTPVLRLAPMAIDPGPSGGRQFGRNIARGIAGGLKR